MGGVSWHIAVKSPRKNERLQGPPQLVKSQLTPHSGPALARRRPNILHPDLASSQRRTQIQPWNISTQIWIRAGPTSQTLSQHGSRFAWAPRCYSRCVTGMGTSEGWPALSGPGETELGMNVIKEAGSRSIRHRSNGLSGEVIGNPAWLAPHSPISTRRLQYDRAQPEVHVQFRINPLSPSRQFFTTCLAVCHED